MTTWARVLVTGGAGFVGSHLCEQLLGQGAHVVCLDDLSTGRRRNVAHLSSDRFRLIEHDVTEPFPDVGPVDLVCHLASAAAPADYRARPVQTLRTGSLGTQRALDVAQGRGARFLLASTSEVYGDPVEHPQRETYRGNVDPVGPRSMYDEAKRYAEALTTAYRAEFGVDTAIARIFNSYGPRMRADDGRMIPTFVGQALAGAPVTVEGDGTQTRSICYVTDTVRGLLALADSGHPGPVNIGSPNELSVNEIAELVRAACGSTSQIVHVAAAADDPRRRCPDLRRARDQLGWQPQVDISSGLASTIGWFADACAV